MKRFVLFLKGICMGSADVIPGVSGGTMALILGIYKELVESIRGLHVRWIPPLWLTGGRKERDWEDFREEFDTLSVPFLLTLGAGILVALGGGSMVIPELMESYPVAMRAFFFGLIVASVWVPFRMIEAKTTAAIVGALLVGVLAAGFGYVATDPGRSIKATQSWTTLESQGETLEDLARRGPSAAPTASVYWADQNAPLRQAIEQAQPAEAKKLAANHDKAKAIGGGSPDKDALKKLSEPYNELEVPAGAEVQVPQPAGWFVFAAGAIAICAMILPGISGSYLLLIFGVYFFVLNAVKGSIEALLAGSLPVGQAGFVLLFMSGAAIGILSFARLLSYLLNKYPTYTLGGLVGLMVGCLRGIWPFRATVDGQTVNALPEAFDATVIAAAVACLVGAAIVTGLTLAGSALDDEEETSEPTA